MDTYMTHISKIGYADIIKYGSLILKMNEYLIKHAGSWSNYKTQIVRKDAFQLLSLFLH